MNEIFISYLFNWCVNGFSIMTSFFAELVHTDNGVTCSDSGFMDLSTEQDCYGAVSYAKSFDSRAYYSHAASKDWNPKGCIISQDNGFMYFNTHSTGGRQYASDYASICRKGNTQS